MFHSEGAGSGWWVDGQGPFSHLPVLDLFRHCIAGSSQTQTVILSFAARSSVAR